jgi:hypothetical protein
MPRYRPERITGRGCAARFGVLLVGLMCSVAGAANGGEPLVSGHPTYGEAPPWSHASPIGAIEYRAGRGLQLGPTGLNIGGFSSFESVRDEGEATTVALEGINLLVLYEPRDWLRAFVEIEAGPIFEYEADGGDFRSRPTVELERFYLDLERSGRRKVRLGRFRTPVGRGNRVPAEPFVWTANDPVFLQLAFADRETGGMLFGSGYPAAGTLSYWRCGQAAEWYLGRWTLTSELTATDGEVEELELWGAYPQAVFEAVPTFYLRQRRCWATGEAIVPVNREAECTARARFTRAVFGGAARWLVTYWNRQYFRGVLPPATLATDEAVKRFVGSVPNAIGYLVARAVDDSVRVGVRLDRR